MDVNETFASIITLVGRILEGDYSGGLATAIAVDATDLAEAVDALDVWLSRGGFLPNAWAR